VVSNKIFVYFIQIKFLSIYFNIAQLFFCYQMLTRARIPANRIGLFQTFTKHYWTGGKFRVKCLSSVEVEAQLARRGISLENTSPYVQRQKISAIIEDEMNKGTLTNENAVELMSFWDIQDLLKKRNLTSVGSGEVLRKSLLQVLLQDETNELVCQSLFPLIYISFLTKNPGKTTISHSCTGSINHFPRTKTSRNSYGTNGT
jgi:hypothetical protein